jgi:hypothetical protein
MPICKKHGKEKFIWEHRPVGRGGVLTRVGCVDCKREFDVKIAKQTAELKRNSAPQKVMVPVTPRGTRRFF